LREIVILLLVVALVVLVIGAVNQDQRVDLDYVFGTWEDVSVLTLSAVAAGAAVVLGLIIGSMARLRVVADRRKLEREKLIAKFLCSFAIAATLGRRQREMICIRAHRVACQWPDAGARRESTFFLSETPAGFESVLGQNFCPSLFLSPVL
jgi:uncharacterized membrane protein YciS (DUF1049 family)